MPSFPVLEALARRYHASKQGRTGTGVRDFQVDYPDLLKLAGCTDGDSRAQAERELTAASNLPDSKLVLERHPRDPSIIWKVRLQADGGEAWLFDTLGKPTPAELRAQWAAFFHAAAADLSGLSEPWLDRWSRWCTGLANAADQGQSIAPFSFTDKDAAPEFQRVLKGVLKWQGPTLLRVASCALCGDSKQLERMAPRLSQALNQLSEGLITSLEGAGLTETPRSVLLHGPLQIHTESGIVNLELLKDASRISAADIENALALTTTATRCLSVENETTFHQLVRLQSGVLLIHTSYPGSGVLQLFERLPADLEYWHFGDTDPAGFDILRDLRTRLARPIQPLHMNFREDEDSPHLSPQEIRLLDRLLASPQLADVKPELAAMRSANRKGRFEQENLGQPSAGWPFFHFANASKR
ncbi:Wadjet anti-phage system protein JetD domain-containing protein [Verrucomicrobium sp. BvORR106]|uniref:Wadjet anti-phage system protein JetD domain-containing protein n=1 Tax=Verrucomicrobium sp. BvORR106 TaxID=1403819 RepID=UPI00056EC325|nr:Wadjet anti-phage system protein JetD domain-containing protein [Verrucomicrobium sp. BvORR106]